MHPNDIKLAALAGLVTFALCALPPVARAGDQHVTCAASVDARQVQARGWTTLPGLAGTLQFRDAEAISAVGPLQDAAWGELKDPPTTKKGDAFITTYSLGTGDSDKYVICYYGKGLYHGEGLYQALKLPAATKECDVVRSPDRKAAKGREAIYGISDIICR
jgi:hypothetical protein